MYKRPVVRKPFSQRKGPGLMVGLPSRIKMTPDDQAPMWSFAFRPVKDWEGYLNCQKMNGASAEELERLEALHKRNWPVKTLTEQAPRKYPTQTVILKTKVTEEGRVLVKVQVNKLALMLKDLHMGKKIPQKVWLEAWMSAGRPYKEILEGLVKLKASRNDPFPLLEVKDKTGPTPKKVLVPVKKTT